MKGERAAPKPGNDVARFGAALVTSAALGAVQLFLVPKRLDVAAFGAWRLFLVYAAYLGVLHLGIADGAFLRWAGRAPDAIAREYGRVARTVLAIQAALVIGALAALAWLAPGLPRTFALAFTTCALGANLTTLAGYALQAAGDFRGAGTVAVLGPGLFVTTVIALPGLTLERVLGAYIAALWVAALVGAMLVRRVARQSSSVTMPESAPRISALVRSGAAVLFANLAASISLFADRILVSASVPIVRFAQYGFASTVMVLAATATQAISRVALSHAARRPAEERGAFLDGFHDLLAALVGVALAGEPVFEALVRHSLPSYVPALPIVRALTLGAPFGVGVHVVIVGTMQSYGLVRRQLAMELAGLAMVTTACGACLASGTPLWVVAAAASGAAAVTWTAGLLLVKRTVGGRPVAGLRFAPTVIALGLSLVAALRFGTTWPAQTAIYVALAAVPTWLSARAAREHGW